MEHYFNENPNSSHNYKIINYSELKFQTDSGVFSGKKVDFGSDLLIKALPELTGTILDMGCGYGPIGISIAHLNPTAKICMADINSRAVELCKNNILSNNIKNAQAIKSNGFADINKTFDIIITNPPIRAGKELIYKMFEESFTHLNTDGVFYTVIQKKQGAPSAKAKIFSVYGNCDAIEKQGGYWVLKACKNGDI
jgi:16S rRNA (guanine1207-N2)-methyltransferase